MGLGMDGMGLARAAGERRPKGCSEGSGSRRCALPLWEIEASWGMQLPSGCLGEVSRHPACWCVMWQATELLQARQQQPVPQPWPWAMPGPAFRLPSVRRLEGPRLPTRGGSSRCAHVPSRPRVLTLLPHEPQRSSEHATLLPAATRCLHCPDRRARLATAGEHPMRRWA